MSAENSQYPTFGFALAFYSVEIKDDVYSYIAYKRLEGLEEILGCFRGNCWSSKTYIASVDGIADIVGIWNHKNNIYMLQKHPGLDMLSPEESESEIVNNEIDD